MYDKSFGSRIWRRPAAEPTALPYTLIECSKNGKEKKMIEKIWQERNGRQTSREVDGTGRRTVGKG